MFIQDLEFIDPLSQKDLQSDFAVKGGASAAVATKADADKDLIVAVADAKATGDYSKATVKTQAKLNKRGKGKKGGDIGYAYAYGAAYGADRYGSIASDISISIDIL